MGVFPLISIVLPTYNGARYIRRALDSIIVQTYRHWELIIVDDCSQDDTWQVIQAYANQDSRIQLIHNEVNQQLPQSLNIGFQAASGQYLTWTSDDNIYLPEALEQMRNCLDKGEYEMVCAGMQAIDENGAVLDKTFPRYDEPTMFLQDTVGACFLYTRAVWEQVGRYSPDLFCVEDFDYWQRILVRFKHIGYLDQCLYQYRLHAASLTTMQAAKVNRQRTKLHIAHFSFLLSRFQHDAAKLSWLYYDFLSGQCSNEQCYDRICDVVPVLLHEKKQISQEKSFAIFGAGEFGECACKLLAGKAALFIDNATNKIGTRKDNLPVYSLDEFLAMGHQVPVLIAVSMEHIYEIIVQLEQAGIHEWYTYYQLRYRNEMSITK